MRSSFSFCKLAAATLVFVATVNAQATTNIPTQTWNIGLAVPATPSQSNAGCVNGLANQADPNGYFDDFYGARYAVRCAQDSDGFVYNGAISNNGRGIEACFRGCDNRPNCRGFYYLGIQNSMICGTIPQ